MNDWETMPVGTMAALERIARGDLDGASAAKIASRALGSAADWLIRVGPLAKQLNEQSRREAAAAQKAGGSQL